MARLERHLENHPDATGRFESRISALEAQFNAILLQLDRIERKLDKH